MPWNGLDAHAQTQDATLMFSLACSCISECYQRKPFGVLVECCTLTEQIDDSAVRQER